MENTETQPVTMLATQDEALVVVAESLLQGAGIKYVVTNKLFQDLVGYGKLGVNTSAGTIGIQVQPEDAQAASDLLKDLDIPKSSLRISRTVRLLVVFFLLGPGVIYWPIMAVRWLIAHL